ncbi:FtsX-like permease family protein [Arcobacter sp. 15-2]|uniref:cell division protein FtsX n=1 Tax=Arcobacter sp. 15-2 TaxID=3374109 RepID=UPI00399C914A
MKLLKSFLSVTFPLVVMLFMFSIYLIVTKVVDNYKQNITNDYAILIIANTPISSIDSLAEIKVKEIEPLSREKIIKGVKDNLSDTSIDLLQKKLPYFYKIYLEEFPTSLKLEQIRKELMTISNISKIETFSNNHNKLYSLLVLVQDIIFILFSAVLLLSILLLSKQIKIWFFEHNDRISIIQLHGGSLIYSSIPIIKTILLSALVSSILASGMLFVIINNIHLILEPEVMTLIPSVLSMEMEILQIFSLSIIIPLITFFGLLVKYKLQ